MFYKMFKATGRDQQRETATAARSDTTPLDDLPDAYYQVDLKGNIIYANEALYRLQAGSAESLPGKNFRRFTTPRSARKAIETFYGVYCTGTPARLTDFELARDPQTSLYLDVSVGLLRDENGEPVGFQGIVTDRTQERTIDYDLERYRNFVESIEDGCFEVDLDGTLTFINEAMCKIHGYPPQDLLGMNHRSFAPPKDAKNIYKTFNQIFSSGAPSRIFDYAIIHKDGSHRYLEVSASLIRDEKGVPIGFRGITRDRTEKKLRELELERYREFIENVDDACYEVDLNGNMTFFNRATIDNFGYSAERLAAMNNRDYSSPETAEKVYAVYNQIYKTGRPAKLPDYEIIGADGKKRYLDTTASLITDVNSNPIGFRGISRDVTDRHNTSRDNARLAEMLSQIQRLEAISNLAAGVAHSFNNLLMSIQGYVSLIEMDMESGNSNPNRFKLIQEKILKGSQLTTQLLNYANADKNTITPADINKITKGVANRYKNNSKGIRIEEFYAESLPLLAVDRSQMEHVLINLLANSEQSMPNGGLITLKTESIVLAKNLAETRRCKPGPYARLTVTDTGEGMDDEIQSHIFEPFFTTKKNGLGAGLGLASVYGIVKSHNGIIEVQSQIGKGTTFTILLPIPAEIATKTQEHKPSAHHHPEAPKKILLVDDESITREMMRKWLTKMGYLVETAQSGEEALAIYQDRHEQIDLVIMDVVMPGMGGNEALPRMGEINPDMKAILVSGFIESSQEEGVIRGGRQAFFHKPVDYQTFSDAIKTLLALK